jgi:hypothetical protein
MHNNYHYIKGSRDITNLIINETDKISYGLSIIHNIIYVYPEITFIALG